MTAMAAEAGVTKPVLYRYFGDRAGLYDALAARYASGLLAELRTVLRQGPGDRAALEAGVDAYLGYVEANAALYRFLAARLPAADPDAPRLVRGFLYRVAGEVAEVLRGPLDAVGVDPAGAELLAFGLTGLVQLAGEAWMERQTMARATAVAYLSDLLWGGLIGIGQATTERTAPT